MPKITNNIPCLDAIFGVVAKGVASREELSWSILLTGASAPDLCIESLGGEETFMSASSAGGTMRLVPVIIYNTIE